jgi:hypothetical protein
MSLNFLEFNLHLLYNEMGLIIPSLNLYRNQVLSIHLGFAFNFLSKSSFLHNTKDVIIEF